MRSILAALALTCLAVPALADGFTLALIPEDTFFEKVTFTPADALAIIAGGMTEAACTEASRMTNAYGSFTACLPDTGPVIEGSPLVEIDGVACAIARDEPTDANLFACYGVDAY